MRPCPISNGMKILLTGGGSKGHVYPVMAVAESLRELAKQHKIVDMRLFFMAPEPYDEAKLYDLGITFVPNTAGKVRRYASILNIFDSFKTGWGIITSMWRIFSIFPDVIFGKGGYASFPALVAGRILGIPVVIHESDMAPGRANKWAGKFAARVAVSYAEAGKLFPHPDRVAVTGQPVRKEIEMPLIEGAHEFFQFENRLPTLFVIGGSQGASLINDAIIEVLPELLKHYQVIHQTGQEKFVQVTKTAEATLYASEFKHRYKPFGYMDPLNLRMAAGAATLIITRAGSTIFEIAAWGKPSIVIPITDSNGDHQRKNAYAYARSGACTVIEEKNLSYNILLSEINRIASSPELITSMSTAAHNFYQAGAADKIASEILEIALEHEAGK